MPQLKISAATHFFYDAVHFDSVRKENAMLRPEMIGVIAYLCSVALALVWILLRRARRKRNAVKKSGRYSWPQRLGIVGILLFMAPLLYSVANALSRGVMILWVFLLVWVHLPVWLSRPMETVLIFSLHSLSLMGVYWLCEMMWPEKSE
jgi:hypothetical protein